MNYANTLQPQPLLFQERQKVIDAIVKELPVLNADMVQYGDVRRTYDLDATSTDVVMTEADDTALIRIYTDKRNREQSLTTGILQTLSSDIVALATPVILRLSSECKKIILSVRTYITEMKERDELRHRLALIQYAELTARQQHNNSMEAVTKHNDEFTRFSVPIMHIRTQSFVQVTLRGTMSNYSNTPSLYTEEQSSRSGYIIAKNTHTSPTFSQVLMYALELVATQLTGKQIDKQTI